jgi:hypothetical protein
MAHTTGGSEKPTEESAFRVVCPRVDFGIQLLNLVQK